MATETAREEKPMATATLRYLRGAPQKVRLVVDQLRGKAVTEALSILRFSPRVVARDLTKVLRSAVANAEQHEVGDLEELVVARAWVDGGPTLKRIRPAPMGRAYRFVHRTSHVTFQLESAGAGKTRRAAKGAGDRSKGGADKGKTKPAGKRKAAAKA